MYRLVTGHGPLREGGSDWDEKGSGHRYRRTRAVVIEGLGSPSGEGTTCGKLKAGKGPGRPQKRARRRRHRRARVAVSSAVGWLPATARHRRRRSPTCRGPEPHLPPQSYHQPRFALALALVLVLVLAHVRTPAPARRLPPRPRWYWFPHRT